MNPSASNNFFCARAPPGYFSFNWPSTFNVRQYGTDTRFPPRVASSAAFAAVITKIPVVNEQHPFTLCFLAML